MRLLSLSRLVSRLSLCLYLLMSVFECRCIILFVYRLSLCLHLCLYLLMSVFECRISLFVYRLSLCLVSLYVALYVSICLCLCLSVVVSLLLSIVCLCVCIYVTSFYSISYYSNVRLISKIELEQNFQSIILDIHASANEHPLILFVSSNAVQTNIKNLIQN